jgi:site-specific recombinase XerD
VPGWWPARPPLTHRLKAYAFDRGLDPGDRLFPIERKRAWQIIGAAAAHAELGKRVYPHLFRHSGAIERLRQTGNPRALQLHLGHASPLEVKEEPLIPGVATTCRLRAPNL